MLRRLPDGRRLWTAAPMRAGSSSPSVQLNKGQII
jgi:hypothetical protein